MDNLIEETRKLSDTLNVWEFSAILQMFTKYAQKDPIERRQLVLEEYFRTLPAKDEATCVIEVDIIKELFPQIDRSYIVKLFDIIGNEANRIRIIIKLLLRKMSKSRKRSNNESCESSPQKKTKRNDETVIDLCQPSSSKAPDMPELVCINQPSTSKAQTIVQVEQSLPKTCEGVEKPCLDLLPTATDRAKVVQWLDIVEIPPVAKSNEESNDPVPKNAAPAYNLHTHLQEMFSNVSMKYIKALCKTVKIDKHEQPPQHLMHLIISTLETKSNKRKIHEDIKANVSTNHQSVATAVSNTETYLVEPKNTVPEFYEKTQDGYVPTEMDYELETLLNGLREDQNNEEPSEQQEEEYNGLVYPLMEIFPEACPNYIRKLCKGKGNLPPALDDLISQILESDYPKRQKLNSPPRQLNISEQLELMKSILVDADPDYLQMQCHRLIDRPEELKEFVAQALETRSYPTLKEFLRKQQISAQQNQYTNEFSVVKFLEVIPDPFQYFNDPNRKIITLDYHSQHYILCYLRNTFSQVSLRAIREIFAKHKHMFLPTCKELEEYPSFKKMKARRVRVSMPAVIQNIPLLQEIAFYDNQDAIQHFLNQRKLKEEVEWKQAKAAGLLQTCCCCYDEEIMLKDIVCCEAGCVFCKDCVRKGAEVAFGDGKLHFLCLSDCTSYFSLQVLQVVLSPKMFSVIALKKQVEEVKAAGIEDLETCPFCDFATIPARDDKLFRCLNPECMKESCRLCKEPSHVPLRCDEVEKDEDVKARTYIENKMTEALLRTCYKCGMKFIKADGCNKMTCSCGALMCYVCGQPVNDYKHFNGPGGEQTQLCPLYSDTNQLHKDAVLKGAEAAKQEIGVNTAKKLKIDPTTDIQQHYISNTRVVVPPAPINPFLGLDNEALRLQERALAMFQQQQARQRHY